MYKPIIYNRIGAGKGATFEACMIQLFRMETSYHVSTATTVGGPG